MENGFQNFLNIETGLCSRNVFHRCHTDKLFGWPAPGQTIAVLAVLAEVALESSVIQIQLDVPVSFAATARHPSGSFSFSR